MRPRALRPDNLTPPTRTPWGGRKILDRYKRDLELGEAARLPLAGESWEVSVEPSFPSRFADDGALLADAIARDPEAWLGREVAARHGGQTPLLVKLVDAAANLSVQVHPSEDDPALAADQSGKPESWYILDAEPGAGLYLGFRDGVDRARVEACLRDRGPLDQLMNFVPVAPGDAFVIRAGMVHAIGAGVTLVEPQFVTPGRRGLTYRYWDWNRRYDPDGQPSDQGTPRELHVERCLQVTDWALNRGAAAVDACRVASRPRAEPAALASQALARAVLLEWPYFAVERWAGAGVLEVPAPGTMLAVVCVDGAADLATEAGTLALRCGQSAVVPRAAGAVTVRSSGVELLITRSV